MFVMNRIHVNKRSDVNFILNISYLTLCLHLNQQKIACQINFVPFYYSVEQFFLEMRKRLQSFQFIFIYHRLYTDYKKTGKKTRRPSFKINGLSIPLNKHWGLYMMSLFLRPTLNKFRLWLCIVKFSQVDVILTSLYLHYGYHFTS